MTKMLPPLQELDFPPCTTLLLLCLLSDVPAYHKPSAKLGHYFKTGINLRQV